MEPDKCSGWQWWRLDELDKRFDEIFYPNRQLMSEYKYLLEPENLKKVLATTVKYKSCYFN